MRIAKCIDELYAEVKDYDIVLCNDAPLALALNNRLDKPLVGTFAVTPRQLAGDLAYDMTGKRLLSEIEIVKIITKRTGYSLRYVHSEIQNIKTIRRYTSNVKNHLSGKKAKTVYDEYMSLPTLDRVMGEFDGTKSEFFKGKKVAVIGNELYDDLDKHFNPDPADYDSISMFKRGEFGIEEIRELSNDRQIADNVVSLIRKETAKDFAIVMDVGGNIADAVRSALYRARLPFINSLVIRDLNNIREYLEFLSLSLTFDTVKVAQIRSLISSYKGFIDSKYDNYIAHEYAKFCKHKRTKELLELMENVTDRTFSEVCDVIAERNAASQIKLLLNEMELADVKVNQTDTGDIVYAVDNIGDLKHNEQIPDYEKEGVLLVDCKNSVYIDRPNVIYIGMGQEWERDISELNFIDYRLKDDESEKNVTRFQVLLQQGTNRFYVCNSIKNGEKPKPCAYFDMCSGKMNEKFSDICGNIIPGAWCENTVPDRIPINASDVSEMQYTPKPFSKSSYNDFATCPRKYMFSRMLGSQDSDSTVLGSFIHNYAELRICYPEIAKKNGIDYYTDIIANNCAGLESPEGREITKTAIRNALINIDRLIDEDRIDTADKKIIPRDKKHENMLFPDDKKQYKCDIAEINYQSPSDHMHGIFDAIVGGHIYDFKTGKVKDLSEIKNEMNYEKEQVYGFEFQSMFYISLIDEAIPNGKKLFTLFFTKDNYNKGMAGEQFDIRDNKRNVILIESKEWYLDNLYFKNHVGKSSTVILEHEKEIIREIKKTGLENITAEFENILVDKFGPFKKTNLESIAQFVKGLIKNLVGKEVFVPNSKIEKADKNCMYITRKAIDDFRKQVAFDYEKIKGFFRTEFPMKNGSHCSKCGFNNVCIREEADIDD